MDCGLWTLEQEFDGWNPKHGEDDVEWLERFGWLWVADCQLYEMESLIDSEDEKERLND